MIPGGLINFLFFFSISLNKIDVSLNKRDIINYYLWHPYKVFDFDIYLQIFFPGGTKAPSAPPLTRALHHRCSFRTIPQVFQLYEWVFVAQTVSDFFSFRISRLLGGCKTFELVLKAAKFQFFAYLLIIKPTRNF